MVHQASTLVQDLSMHSCAAIQIGVGAGWSCESDAQPMSMSWKFWLDEAFEHIAWSFRGRAVLLWRF